MHTFSSHMQFHSGLCLWVCSLCLQQMVKCKSYLADTGSWSKSSPKPQPVEGHYVSYVKCVGRQWGKNQSMNEILYQKICFECCVLPHMCSWGRIQRKIARWRGSYSAQEIFYSLILILQKIRSILDQLTKCWANGHQGTSDWLKCVSFHHTESELMA